MQNTELTPLEQWTVRSRDGDDSALNHLAEYLLPKAFDFANRKMMHLSPMDDYEDVAISAVKSVCLRFRQGRNEFLGEMELDSLLRQFVIGKIRDRRKYHLRDKRDIELNVVKNDSQTPCIRSGISGLSTYLLRRHILRRACRERAVGFSWRRYSGRGMTSLRYCTGIWKHVTRPTGFYAQIRWSAKKFCSIY